MSSFAAGTLSGGRGPASTAGAGRGGGGGTAEGGAMSVEKKLNCSLDDLVKMQRRSASTAAGGRYATATRGQRGGRGRGGVGRGAAGGRYFSTISGGGAVSRQGVFSGVQRTSRSIAKTPVPATSLRSRGRGGGLGRFAAGRSRGNSSTARTAGVLTGLPGPRGSPAAGKQQQQQQLKKTAASNPETPSLAERLAQPLENSIAAGAAARRREAAAGRGLATTPGKITTGAGAVSSSSRNRAIGGALSAQRKFLASRMTSAAARTAFQRNRAATIAAARNISRRALLLRRRAASLRAAAAGTGPGAAVRPRTTGIAASRVRTRVAPLSMRAMGGTSTALLRAGGRTRALLLRQRAAGGFAAGKQAGQQKGVTGVRRTVGTGLISKSARKRANKKAASAVAAGGIVATSPGAAAAVGGGAAGQKRGRGTASAAGRAAAAANVRSSSSNSSTAATAGTPPRRSALRARRRAAVARAAQLPLNTSINRQAAWAAGGGGGGALATGAGVGALTGGYVVVSGSSRVAAHAARAAALEASVNNADHVSTGIHPGAVLRTNATVAAAQQQRVTAASASDLELMSKIKIMATLEKVPPLMAAQRGLAVTPPHALSEAALVENGFDGNAAGVVGDTANNIYGNAAARSGAPAAHLPYQSYTGLASNNTDTAAQKGRSLSDRFSKYAAVG